MAGRTPTEERSASQPRTSTVHAATAVFASARGPDRPGTKAAAAMSAQASRRPATAAHASARWTG